MSKRNKTKKLKDNLLEIKRFSFKTVEMECVQQLPIYEFMCKFIQICKQIHTFIKYESMSMKFIHLVLFFSWARRAETNIQVI